MRGFEPQKYADGGLVQGVKRIFGMDEERNARVAAYRAQAAQEKAAQEKAKQQAQTPAPAPAISDYSGMGAMKRREKEQGLADGGRVRPRGFVSGPGTETSDSIPARLSDGEYVLPADTVRAVGVDKLDALRAATHTPARGFSGKDGPEFFFAGGSPGGVWEDDKKRRSMVDQIPTGGVTAPANDGSNDSTEFSRNVNNAINAMGGMGVVASVPLKGAQMATKAVPPAAGTAPMLTNAAAKAAPAADFVAGMGPGATTRPGAIPRIGNAPTPTLPGTNAALQEGAQANALSAAARATAGAGAAATAMDSANSSAPSTQAAPAGPETQEWAGKQMSYGDQMRNVGRALMNAPLAAIKTVVSAPGYGLSANESQAAPAGTPAAQAAAPSAAGGGRGFVNPDMVSPQAQPPAAPPPRPQPEIEAGPAAPTGGQVMPGIYRNGNSYSDTAQGAASMQARGMPSEQNMAALNVLAGRQQQESEARVSARGFAPAGGPGSGPVSPGSFTGGFSGVIGTDPRKAQQERERSDLVSAMTTPVAGSRGLTAAQRNGALQLMNQEQQGVQARERNAASLEQTRMQGDVQRETTGMREAGETGRTAIREQGEAARAGARNAIDNRRMGLEEQARGFDIRAGERQEKLYQKYEAAKTPEEKAAVAQQIRDLSGKQAESPWKLQVTPTTKNADGSTTDGSIYRYNSQTGAVERVDAGQGAKPAPAVPADSSKRVVGQTYTAPNGKTVQWTGNGWLPL